MLYLEVIYIFWRCFMSRYHGDAHSKAERDNHANQLNPNNDVFWESRGHDDRPEDWEEQAREEEEDG
jgi:hypothetical protein